jgi:pilus assembly protein Flp/PilA
MSALNRLLHEFAADRRGATAVEYGLIVGLIFLAVLASINSVASATTAMYAVITGAMH